MKNANPTLFLTLILTLTLTLTQSHPQIIMKSAKNSAVPPDVASMSGIGISIGWYRLFIIL